jgi:hypothetical protein
MPPVTGMIPTCRTFEGRGAGGVHRRAAAFAERLGAGRVIGLARDDRAAAKVVVWFWEPARGPGAAEGWGAGTSGPRGG